MKKQKEKQKSVPKEAREDFFANAKSMILSSVGRLPTALVVILLVSMAMAAMTGLVLQLNRASDHVIEFMPFRLTPTPDSLAIDNRKIQGNWVYQTADYAMVLTFIGDRFDWIIKLGDVQEAQFFARGNFRIDGDVMVLGIRPDLGTPVDPSKPWIKFMPMSMRDINTKIQFDGKKIIWDVPASEQKRIIAQSGRIFVGHEDGHIEWTKQ
jgi:hypothetical protein